MAGGCRERRRDEESITADPVEWDMVPSST
jgi:hypothetical protein